MKYYLVVRDENTKENSDVLQFDTMQQARHERDQLKKKTAGEVVLVYAKDIKAMFSTFSEYKPKNWKDYVARYSKKASTKLNDAHLEKQMKVEDCDVHLLHRSLPGSREFPPEGAEVDVKHATLAIPALSVEDAEKLPTDFIVQKSYTYDDDSEVVDLVLTFHVHVTSKKPMPNGKVDIEYTDTLKDWDYY